MHASTTIFQTRSAAYIIIEYSQIKIVIRVAERYKRIICGVFFLRLQQWKRLFRWDGHAGERHKRISQCLQRCRRRRRRRRSLSYTPYIYVVREINGRRRIMRERRQPSYPYPRRHLLARHRTRPSPFRRVLSAPR